MIEKISLVQEQFKLTIPKEIRSNIDVKIGTVVKWIIETDSISTGKVTLTFVNV